MEIHYCDLCPNILERGRNVLVIVHDKEFEPGKKQPTQPPPRTYYEVCDSCIQLIHKIMKHKKGRLKEVLAWIDSTYELPAKNKPKEKDRG